MKPDKERRIGKERRANPPVCTQPCEPIKEELEKIYEYIKEEFKEVISCIHKKIPTHLYYWSFGGLCTFTVLIVGGFQWKILENQKLMNASVEVVKTQVVSMGLTLDYHIRIDDARHLRQQDKIDELYKKNGWRNNREP